MTDEEKRVMQIQAAKVLGWSVVETSGAYLVQFEGQNVIEYAKRTPVPCWDKSLRIRHIESVEDVWNHLCASNQIHNPFTSGEHCVALLVAISQQEWFDAFTYRKLPSNGEMQALVWNLHTHPPFVARSSSPDTIAAYREGVTIACVKAWELSRG